jgi:cardiolipin synthase
MGAPVYTWTTGIIAAGYYILVILTIVILVFRKRETASIYGWCLAIIFLPGLGILCFFLFGLQRIPRRLKKKVVHKSDFQDRFPGEERFHRPAEAIEDGEKDPWKGLYRLGERLGSGPVREGNEVALLRSGEETFAHIFEAIEQAEHHVHIQKYIFRQDHLGTRLMKLLARRASEGVEVRLIVDAIGSIGAWRHLDALKKSGGKGAVFLPLLPIPINISPNLRNHRKIVICDGRIGFMGGMNVGEEYLGRRKRNIEWCDAHLMLRGPAVLDLQRVFAEDWDYATEELLAGDKYFPHLEPRGDTALQIVPSGPDQDVNAARQIYMAAINQSRKRILLASPYVVPDQSLRDAIINAALRGIEVILLTQKSPPDHWLPYWSSRYYWQDLLESGVRIYQFQPGMMHAKVMVVDGIWASVGSVNFDMRSLRLNFEVSGITADKDFVSQVEEAFETHLSRSWETEIDAFQARSRVHRVCEAFAHLFAPLL